MAWASGDFEQSAKLYRQAVLVRPSWPEGWGYLAASLYQLKHFAEARDAYKQTARLTPNNGPSWAFLGLCEYELHDYRHAFGDLVQGRQLGLGSDHNLQVMVNYRMALLWITAGEFALGMKELAWFAQGEESNADVIQATGLAVLRMPLFPADIPAEKREVITKAGEAGFVENSRYMDDARTLYEKLVTDYPNEPNVHYARGRFMSHLDPDIALREFDKELEISPSHVQARIEAGYLCLKKGEFEKALTFARDAVKIEPRNSLAHHLAGQILFETDHAAEAVPELEQASRLAPNIVDFHLSLARAYQKAGNRTLAAKEMAVFNELDKKRNGQLELQKKHEAEAQPHPPK